MARPRWPLVLAALLTALPARAARAEVEDGTGSVSLALAGDVFVDAPIRNVLERRSYKVGRLRAYRELLAEVEPALRAADLTLVNLESPVSPRYRDRAPGESPIFNAPPELLQALHDAGVDAVSLANNHAYDQGYRGLQDTVDVARRAGLAVVGVGRTPEEAPGPIVLTTPGGSIAICAWTQGANRLPREVDPGGLDGRAPLRVALLHDGTAARCLARARARAKLVVASIHWTSGEWYSPGPEHRRVALALADAGADVIMGHGPHRPAPAELIRAADGRPVRVIFSLGNLVGAMGTEHREWLSPRPSVRDGLIAVVRVGPGRAGRLAPRGLKIVPLWISGVLPRAPWWPDGHQGLIRPLSVDRELQRLASAKCGSVCLRRAEGYQRRLEALNQALALNGSWPDRPEPPLAVAASGTEARSEGLAPAEPEVPSPEVAVAPRPAPEPSPPRPPPEPPRPPSPAPSHGTEAEPELNLAALRRGVTLPLRFNHNQVHGEIHDEERLRRIVELVQRHRELRIHLIGHGVEGETLMELPRLGRRRARSAAWEISSRGPSRSRFVMEGGEPLARGGEARVELRLVEHRAR